MKKFQWPVLNSEKTSAPSSAAARRLFRPARSIKYFALILMVVSLAAVIRVLPSPSAPPATIDAMMQRSSASKTDEQVIRIFQNIQKIWMKGLIRFLQLRGYRRVREDIWERREKYATYRVNSRTGEWTFIYEVNPRRPRAGWDSPISQFFGSKEYDFTGQPSRLCFRFGGDGHSNSSV